MRRRLAILTVAALLLGSLFVPAALAFEELELQAATDTLQNAGLATVDAVFWRSGFGASILGGPSFAGNTTAFNARVAAIEGLAGGSTPMGVRPVFLEFADLQNATYASASVNASDYATQRWNFTNASRVTGASTLGLGAAADAAWAAHMLRTNHYPNGTQDPSAPLVGPTGADGVFGLWLVEGLDARVSAITAHGAWNGTGLTAFNFTDSALNDNNASNGVQAVPDAVGVLLSSDPEPLFQGFSPQDNASSIAGEAALILGLAKVMELADPLGPQGALFDGSPFGATLYGNASQLLVAVVMNGEALHWDASASAYTQPGGRVQTGDLALYVAALAEAEKAAGPAIKANITAERVRALSALTGLANAYGVFPGAYDVAGATVTADWSNITLWSQATALTAVASVYNLTGLKAHYDWMFRASAGLESPLFHNGSYHAVAPEPALSTFTALAVASTAGALRDLALTGEEPLAIYRLVNATQWLFTAPPLKLAGANAPPVIGASFVWNATNESYEAGATAFNAAGGLYAAYEFLSVGPEFYAKVGGGVPVTERAALLLHNATAADVGAAVDTLDQQVAALSAQLTALQASFDTLNNSVSNVTGRLNLSLENETISAQRIADLQANVTALRAQLAAATSDLGNATADLANKTGDTAALEARFTAVQNDLNNATQNVSNLQGRLNVTASDLEGYQTALKTTNATLDAKLVELGHSQGATAGAVVAGIAVGAVLMFFVQRFVLAPKAKGPKDDDEPEGKAAKGKGRGADARKSADEGDKDNDDDDDLK